MTDEFLTHCNDGCNNHNDDEKELLPNIPFANNLLMKNKDIPTSQCLEFTRNTMNQDCQSIPKVQQVDRLCL